LGRSTEIGGLPPNATHLPTDQDHSRFDDERGQEHFATLQRSRSAR